MFGIDAAIYVYCTYVFVENKNLKPETWNLKHQDTFHAQSFHMKGITKISP